MAFPYTDLSVTISVYLGADPTAAPGTWPVATDFSSRLLNEPIQISRGRPQGQKTLASGSCSFVLDNSDGALTPQVASSTYYGQWDLGVPVKVAVDGVGASPPYTRFCGFVASIEETLIPGVGGVLLRAVKVTLGGKVRQMSQGSVALSALRRTISGSSPVFYWPLEDGSEATSAASAVLGGPPMTRLLGSVQFAADTTLPGASQTPVFDTDDWLTVSGLSGGSSTSWHAEALIKITVDNATSKVWFNTASATHAQFRIATQSTAPLPVAVIIGAPNTITATLNGAMIDDYLGSWHHYAVTAEQSGGNIVTRFYVDGVLQATDTTAGTLAAVNGVSAFSTVDGTSIAHVVVGDGLTLSGAESAFNGYRGEQAHVRFGRICTQEGIPYSTTASESRECGPQPVADTMAILRDLELTDHGVLAEDITTWGLTYMAGAQRANRSAALTVNLTTYRVMAPEGGFASVAGDVLTPVRNDQRIRNEWTISRPNGVTVTALDAAHQRKKGRYNDSAEVNVYTDAAAADEAGWRLWEGIYDGLRYRTMTLDCGANAADAPTNHLGTWLASVNLGYRIDRTGSVGSIQDETMTLEGYTETIRRRAWQVAAAVEPHDPWRVGILANTAGDTDPLLGRLAGDDAAAIRATITNGTTSVAFDPNFYRWTTDSDDFTPALRVRTVYNNVAGGGEIVTASAIATTAATFVAAGTAAHADNAAVAPGNYAGGAAGDWVCVLAGSRDTTSPTLTITDANYTYTQLGIEGGLYFWAAVRTSTNPAPTVTPTGGAAGDTVSAVVFGLRNMPITLSLDQYVLDDYDSTNASAQDVAYGAVMPGIYAGRVILILARKSDDWTGVAPPSGFTEAVDVSTVTGNDQGLAVYYRIDTTPTAVVSGSLVVTGGASAVSESLVLALAGGFQTMTVTRSVNGVVKAHTAGTRLAVDDPLVLTL